VSRCGGGKALTKQTADETTLKCHMTVEGANKVSESVTKMMGNNALVICNVNASPENEDQLKTTPIKTGIKSETDRLGKIMPELYNLENCVKSEKPVKIDLDLDLYQMENY
jgi:cell division GTPase FtsZ